MTKEALEASIKSANVWSGRATLALAIGILGEYVLLPFLEKRRWHKLAQIFFAILVVAGIVGEYEFSSQIAQHAAELQRLSDTEVAQANKGAAEAMREAAQLQVEADELEERVLDQGPRELLLNGKREETFMHSIHQFKGQKVQVRICSFNIKEVRDTAERLTALFREAEWVVSPNSPDWGESNCLINEPLASGIWVGTPNPAPTTGTRERAKELVRFFEQIPLCRTGHGEEQ